MSSGLKVEKIAAQIRSIYQSAESDRTSLVEELLQKETSHLSYDERIAFGDRLKSHFQRRDPQPSARSRDQFKDLIFELELAENISYNDKSLASCLNLVFNSLDELISAINEVISRESTDESIRTAINSSIPNKKEDNSLEEYLAQIRQGLGIMDKAYRNASLAIIKELLDALAPHSLSDELGKGMKLGPFRKAEIFSLYEDRFQAVNKWLNNDMFFKAFSKEFEKSCQQIYSEKKEF